MQRIKWVPIDVGTATEGVLSKNAPPKAAPTKEEAAEAAARAEEEAAAAAVRAEEEETAYAAAKIIEDEAKVELGLIRLCA
jgi:hypothetical protein